MAGTLKSYEKHEVIKLFYTASQLNNFSTKNNPEIIYFPCLKRYNTDIFLKMFFFCQNGIFSHTNGIQKYP